MTKTQNSTVFAVLFLHFVRLHAVRGKKHSNPSTGFARRELRTRRSTTPGSLYSDKAVASTAFGRGLPTRQQEKRLICQTACAARKLHGGSVPTVQSFQDRFGSRRSISKTNSTVNSATNAMPQIGIIRSGMTLLYVLVYENSSTNGARGIRLNP